MSNWFECKVKYDKTFKEGEEPQLSKPETYMVDALSFTEAEARVIEEVTPYAISSLEVLAVKKTNITELVESENPMADKWFRAKIVYINLDNDKEKRSASHYLVQGCDFEDAFNQLVNVGLKGIQSDYDIASIAETPIMDVFKYKPKKEETQE